MQHTKKLAVVALTVAAMCTAASAAGIAYQNTTGGWVYQLNAPTGWAVVGAANIVLPGAGPDGGDAWYRYGATGGQDDPTQAFWDFSFADLPNVGHDLEPGQYAMQAYVSDYGSLLHEDDGVFGSRHGPWGWNALGNFSSWNGVSQATPGWTDMGDWTGGYVWLSKTGDPQDMTISVKWNPWSGYGGLAVSGVRISTDGNFEPIPEPATALLALLGLPLLRRRIR